MKRKYRMWMIELQLYDGQWIENERYSEDNSEYIYVLDDDATDAEILDKVMPKRPKLYEYEIESQDESSIYINRITKDGQSVPTVDLTWLEDVHE